jgi:hypothetical protein
MAGNAGLDAVFAPAPEPLGPRCANSPAVVEMDKRVARRRTGANGPADVMLKLPVVEDDMPVAAEHIGQQRQRLEHRAKAPGGGPQCLFGTLALVDVAAHDDQSAIRRRMHVEADPTTVQRRRQGLDTDVLACRQRELAGTIGLIRLDAGKSVAQPLADDPLGALSP